MNLYKILIVIDSEVEVLTSTFTAAMVRYLESIYTVDISIYDSLILKNGKATSQILNGDIVFWEDYISIIFRLNPSTKIKYCYFFQLLHSCKMHARFINTPSNYLLYSSKINPYVDTADSVYFISGSYSITPNIIFKKFHGFNSSWKKYLTREKFTGPGLKQNYINIKSEYKVFYCNAEPVIEFDMLAKTIHFLKRKSRYTLTDKIPGLFFFTIDFVNGKAIDLNFFSPGLPEWVKHRETEIVKLLSNKLLNIVY